MWTRASRYASETSYLALPVENEPGSVDKTVNKTCTTNSRTTIRKTEKTQFLFTDGRTYLVVHENVMVSQMSGKSTLWWKVWWGWHETKHHSPSLQAACEGNPPATRDFLSEMASNIEHVSMPWNSHIKKINENSYGCVCGIFGPLVNLVHLHVLLVVLKLCAYTIYHHFNRLYWFGESLCIHAYHQMGETYVIKSTNKQKYGIVSLHIDMVFILYHIAPVLWRT